MAERGKLTETVVRLPISISTERGRVLKRDATGQIVCIVAPTALLGCSAAERAEQIAACERTLASTLQAQILVGREGSEQICRCTVDSIATIYPDAAHRWSLYTADMDRRLDNRGVVGVLADTSWARDQGREMVEFARVQAEVVIGCTGKTVSGWTRSER